MPPLALAGRVQSVRGEKLLPKVSQSCDKYSKAVLGSHQGQQMQDISQEGGRADKEKSSINERKMDSKRLPKERRRIAEVVQILAV